MWWWLAACIPPGGDTTPPPPTDDPVDTDTTPWLHSHGWGHSGHSAAAHSAASKDTGGTTDTGPDPCAGPPPTQFRSSRTLSQVLRTEEFAFDTNGKVVNAQEGTGIYETTYVGQPQLLSPYNSWELAGTRVTPDGLAVAVADEAGGSIVAFNLATGAQTVLASGISSPNSIGFDLRGWLYVAGYGHLTRYRGVGALPEVLINEPFSDFDGVAFAPDDSAVYINADSQGDIWHVRFDAAGEVLGAGSFIQLPLDSELDGMTTDVCGNLYVIYTNGRLRRIRTDLYQETLIQPNGRYTTSISFGSGFGGFERDHLYMMDRNSGLLDLELGIEGRREPHYPP